MQNTSTPIKIEKCTSRSSQSNFPSLKPLTVLFGLLFVFFGAAAQVPIVYYDFESNTDRNNTFESAPEIYLAGITPSSIVRVGTGTIGSAAGAGVALSGSVTGATAGKSLSSANWSTESDPGTAATEYYQFSVNSTGLADLGIDLDVRGSATSGAMKWGMLFSTDNGLTYNSIGSTGGAKNVTSTYTRLNLKFDGAAIFDNHPNLIFRIYAYKANNATSTFEIDNLAILAKTFTTSKTLLDEAHIYTCMTSGATGGITTRDALKVSGAGTVVTMASGLALATSLEMAGGTLQVGSYNLTLNCPSITGTTAETGIITTSASSLTIGGKATETTTLLPALKLPANITQLNNLTIYRTNGASLDNNLLLNGALTLTSGNLTTTISKKLTIGKNGTINGGNDASFINGPITHIVADINPVTKVFPVGKGTSYRPVTLTLTQDAVTETSYTIEQKEGSHSQLAIPVEEDLKTVSGVRYFAIRKSAGANLTAGTVTLSFGANDWVNDPTELRIAKTNADSSAWINLGRHASSSIASTGTITSSINFTSFSDFLIANSKNGNNSLPVEFASFTATKKSNAVQLDWTTASEKENKGFEVQVSGNGSEFRSLGFVASKQSNTATVQTYSYTDTEANYTGTVYYRLKQIDLNGTASYSALRAIKFGKEKIRISAYPNPFEQNITIDITGQANQATTLEITDALGRKVYGREISLEQGANQVVAAMPASATSGIYTLTVKHSDGITTHKIIKK